MGVGEGLRSHTEKLTRPSISPRPKPPTAFFKYTVNNGQGDIRFFSSGLAIERIDSVAMELTGSPATGHIKINCLPHYPKFNPLPDDKMLDWSKLKQIADNILKRI